MEVKITITDDHPIVLQGMSSMLSSYPQFKILDKFVSGNELLAGLAKRQPDVLLLDILMPDISGINLTKVIHKQYPDIRMIAFTSIDAPSMVKSMLTYGCLGYVLKGANQHTVIEAIEHAYRCEEYIEASLKEHLVQNLLKSGRTEHGRMPNLTTRELEVLQLVAQEYTTQEIADKLCISMRTAETHRLSILKKLGVKNSAGLVLRALQWGFIGGGGKSY